MIKTVTLQIRITEPDHRRWLQAARLEQRTLSDWARLHLNIAAPADPEVLPRPASSPLTELYKTKAFQKAWKAKDRK